MLETLILAAKTVVLIYGLVFLLGICIALTLFTFGLLAYTLFIAGEWVIDRLRHRIREELLDE